MARENIYTILERKSLDPTKAFSRIRYQFDHVTHSCQLTGFYHQTLKRIIADNLFSNLSIRGSCVTLDDLLGDLDIQLYNSNYSFDSVFCFIEFILCIIDSVPASKLYTVRESGSKTIFDDILFTIDEILKKINYKIVQDQKGRRIVIPCDSKVELAVELINEGDISLEMLQYNHYTNKGNIKDKKKILKTLSDYIEPKLKNRTKSELANDISFMLNNFDIRHNNKEGKNRNDFILEMEDDEKESWYDKLYVSIVALIINEEIKTLHDDLKKFK